MLIRQNTPYFQLIFVFIALLLFGSHSAQAHDRRTPVVEAVEKAGPAVVNIRTEQVVKRRSSPFFGFSDPFFDDFFREFLPPRTYKTQALGSGVIIDPRGYVLTNSHVVEKASKIFVALPDSRKEIEAELVGRAERIDLAVLKLGEQSTYPSLSPSAGETDLMVGETVIAIGNPLGLGHSVTTGVVSAPQRRVPLQDKGFAVFIQTDALINPGNSGGPLLNINGELIGINTAIVQQAQGIGFAIPISMARRVLSDLISHGFVRRPYTGILAEQVGSNAAKDWGSGGVLVGQVDDASPAAKAGIRFGDVITALDGVAVDSPQEFVSLLETYTPGTTIQMEIMQGFKTRSTELKLAAMPKGYGLRYCQNKIGFSVRDGRGNVEVADVKEGTPAARAGIARGDTISEVAGKSVSTVEEFGTVIEEMIGREPIRFLIIRGRRGYYLELP